ncbi:MAG: nucleoside-diphosphate sugar epimerase [Cyanobium sp. CACIAM 14]|nr:MAG: nucleoside-diphosphate sugar epimerase [Cyanobium sp. CACIAM 14]
MPAAAAAIGRMLVLGGGYTGRRMAEALERAGVPVVLTRRQPLASQERPGWLRFDPHQGVLPSPQDLLGITHVLVTIPPDAGGRDPVLDALLARLLELPLDWLGYLSTTGVYGDTGGAWVDESSPTRPLLERSRARLACEEAWRRSGLPVQVLRLPGIYGPGRNPLENLRNGTARLIHKPGQVFSRIHVDDIVGGLLHCIALPAVRRPETLILADRFPCPSSELLGLAAHLLGCPLPPFERFDEVAPSMSGMARSFWSENRRACSRLLRRGLGYRLLYPSYWEGLSSGVGSFFGAPKIL